jgi:hypothetical protein
MQAPAQARSANGAVFYTPDGKPLEIRDVWAEVHVMISGALMKTGA